MPAGQQFPQKDKKTQTFANWVRQLLSYSEVLLPISDADRSKYLRSLQMCPAPFFHAYGLFSFQVPAFPPAPVQQNGLVPVVRPAAAASAFPLREEPEFPAWAVVLPASVFPVQQAFAAAAG